MSAEGVLSIVFGLISVLLSFIGYYFYVRSRVYSKTEDAVNNAEVEGMIGRDKLKAATEQLYLTVPAVLKPFIGREQIGAIVQRAFDKIEEFAEKQYR